MTPRAGTGQPVVDQECHGNQDDYRALDPKGVDAAGGQTAETFEPFGMGLVQLGDEVKVEGRLTESDPAKLAFGMEVELTFIPFFVDGDGSEVMTYAFTPA